MTRKWSIVNDNSKPNYGVGDESIYNKEVLESNLCSYNDAYILVKGDVTITGDKAHQVAFKNCAPFIKCITKIDETAIDQDLDLVMPMYNLIQCTSNYGNLWFYSKDEATNFNADIVNDDNFKSFKYKAKIIGNTAPNGAN